MHRTVEVCFHRLPGIEMFAALPYIHKNFLNDIFSERPVFGISEREIEEFFSKFIEQLPERFRIAFSDFNDGFLKDKKLRIPECSTEKAVYLAPIIKNCDYL